MCACAGAQVPLPQHLRLPGIPLRVGLALTEQLWGFRGEEAQACLRSLLWTRGPSDLVLPVVIAWGSHTLCGHCPFPRPCRGHQLRLTGAALHLRVS